MKVYGVFHNDILCFNTYSLAVYHDYVSADMHKMTRETLVPGSKYGVREMELEEVLE